MIRRTKTLAGMAMFALSMTVLTGIAAGAFIACLTGLWLIARFILGL